MTEKLLISAAHKLRDESGRLRFKRPVTHVYNPLDYAWNAHEAYLRRFGNSHKEIVFLGMNPGPFGMAQTGVPFGEISAVRDWMKIKTDIGRPSNEHPRRPILGFDCARAEVSGQRLWGLFAARFGVPEKFFQHHFVANYCPLVFMEESGRNRTPDKLAPTEMARLYRVCDAHLRLILEALHPKWVIGVGDFAAKRAMSAIQDLPVRIARILHPSPASPAANRDWSGQVTRQMIDMGAWTAEK